MSSIFLKILIWNFKFSDFFLKLTKSNIENFNAVPSADFVILGEFRSSTWEQITCGIPIGFLQNSTPSNKNSLGVVLTKKEVVGPKMLFNWLLTTGKKSEVSDSTLWRIDCLKKEDFIFKVVNRVSKACAKNNKLIKRQLSALRHFCHWKIEDFIVFASIKILILFFSHPSLSFAGYLIACINRLMINKTIHLNYSDSCSFLFVTQKKRNHIFSE